MAASPSARSRATSSSRSTAKLAARRCDRPSRSTPSAAASRVLDPAAFETPSTKAAAQALAKWDATRPTLVVLDAEEVGALKSFRNIERVTVAEVGSIGVADVIGAASLVVSEGALEKLKERLG